MDEYEKVKAVVYKHIPTIKNRKTKSTLSGIDLVKVSTNYENHLFQMEEDDLIKFDLDSTDRIILGTIKTEPKGDEESINY